MSATHEIAAAIGDSGPPRVGFRQGAVVAFNSNTGQNTIDVGDALLEDVPMLNSGEAVALKAGHNVALLTFSSSWWIMGRITLPGSDQFASASVAFATARDYDAPVTITTGAPGAIKASATLIVPVWADQAMVFAQADATGDNTSAQNDDAFYVYAKIASTNGSENMVQVPSNKQLYNGASFSLLINDPGSTIDVGCGMRTNLATWSGGNNRSAINAIALFRSVS